MTFLEDLWILVAGYEHIVIAVIMLIIFAAVAKLVSLLIHRYVSRIAGKTKSNLDDIILEAVRKPIAIGIFLAGLYSSLVLAAVIDAATVNTTYTLIIVGYFAYFSIRIVNAVLTWYGKEIASKTESRTDDQAIPVIKKIVYLVIGTISVMWLMSQMGIEITTIIAAFGIGGLAVALALQDTLSNFFSGMHMIIDRPVKIGDYVELDSGEKGYMEDIGWRSTKIKLLSNNIVIIPNNKFAQSKIINYDSPSQDMGLVIPCGVSYESDLEKVERIVIEVAREVEKRVEGAVKDFEPFVRFNEFGDSNIKFSVILRVRKFVDKYLVTHEFIKALKKRFDKEGIEISWPVAKVRFSEDMEKHLTGKRKK